ncbi:MAG: pyridoxamine 5'-phosphate oxidase family protein [Acidimicrobiia bacterium]
MSAEERREFLLTGTRTGMLATTRADGSPHVVPITPTRTVARAGIAD